MRPTLFLSLVLGALGASPLAGQICSPMPGTGQPGLPVPPPCMFAVPPPVVWAVGNPLYEVGAFAPLPAMLGHPMLLVIGVPAPAFLPIPAPPLFPPYGPGLLTSAVFLLVIPSGPAMPAPSFSAIPIPATGGPLGLVATAHTVVLLGPTVALSLATAIVI